MFHLALPLAAANLLQMMVHAIDVIFVARLGDAALAAASLSVAIFGLLVWSGSGLVGAAAPLMAAELGKRSHAVREVRRTMRMALWLSFLLSCLFMAICWMGKDVMLATGQPPATAERAGSFLRILMWATFPMIASAVLRVFVATLGRPTIATMITFLALFVNALGNWTLVFGNLGMPELGLYGSAVSSVITSFVMMFAYIIVIQTDRRFRRFHIFGNFWRAEWQRFRDMIRIGLPIALTILAEAGLFTGAAFLMGRIGESELAGHTIALQVASLAFQIPFGVAQAATIRVGLAYGAKDHLGIALAARSAFLLGVGFMVLTCSIMWFAPKLVLSIYVDVDAPQNAALVGFALQFLVIAAAFQLADGAQAVAAGALRGLQDTRTPMFIAMFGYWAAGYGTSIYLGFWTDYAGVGVWIGLAVGLLVAAILLMARWHFRAAFGLLPKA
ncbi:MATE family efflux transporter [Sphingopyxis yananensis]|uniref:MATE family efflux transporter n=1 Tax=Sphingopyxis yananensis TaxID=2886687 RepID=UPI001D0FABA3|nr:MATE family efflux transporter [Sphingopyxis yananensis]MCC2601807.1 MATE family efflux transporter [Sphingopyxis yananensis]